MNYGLILAAGTSSRFGGNKLFASLWGRPVVEHVLLIAETSPQIKSVFVAYNKEDKTRIAELCKKVFTKPYTLVEGGKTRFDSSVKLINIILSKQYLQKKDRFVVLNGANPLASLDEIDRCLKACKGSIKGVAVGRLVTSSIKRIAPEPVSEGVFRVIEDIDRTNVCEMQTPQVVCANEYADIVQMIELLGKIPNVYTDEIAVLGLNEKKTAVVLANEYNHKITTRSDLDMLNGLITSVGTGEDSHTLIKSQKQLMLGGVAIKSDFAFEADSDGDVILHAIANAFSSSMGGGSLGTFATAMCEDGISDSKEYIKVLLKKKDKHFLCVAHVSLSIEGSYPKIDVHASEIRSSLSTLLDLPLERIGITATTGKNHSAYGKGRALKCIASLILRYV